jgi:uncharacterized protein (TIGR00251 family)
VLDLHEKGNGVTLRLKVQPRASRTEIVGEHAGAIKIKVAAPPVDGKANEECRRFLAKLLKVGATSIEIIAGDSSRDKVIRVSNVTAQRVLEALGAKSGRDDGSIRR